MSDDYEVPLVAICIHNNIRTNERIVGAAVHKRELLPISNDTEEDAAKHTTRLELFEFRDNDHYSHLDSFLNQMGKFICYISEEYDSSKAQGDDRKVTNLLTKNDIEIVYQKKASFAKKPETLLSLQKLVGSHTLTAEIDRPLALICVECLIQNARLLESEDVGRFVLKQAALGRYMRLDTAAADAVNLLKNSNGSYEYGSIFGVLNRCKTKMGSRLLETWLRQPLLNVAEINTRLNIVQALKESTVGRNKLRDTLRGVPDVNSIVAKMNKGNAGLLELYSQYLFVKSIPIFVDALDELAIGLPEALSDGGIEDESVVQDILRSIKNKFSLPLEVLSQKFSKFQELVNLVIDLSKLPELKVASKYDPVLLELEEEEAELKCQAERIWSKNFSDVKLDLTHKEGFVLRSTKTDDERKLKETPDVTILQILKNGIYFTTPKLHKLAQRYLESQKEYKQKQQIIVDKAMETAKTFMPVVESLASLIAELDVLTAFATAAAVAPGEYTRPRILEQGGGVLHFKNARHPCVELMENVQFIANDYSLQRGESNFQIIVGPNMGGKSTYIRGIGCLVVMAQVGMFVPCSDAELSLVDCILARVGAGDAVQKGVSTFMAEMLESAVILETATKDSLLIIDELGRGTSTFDGFGLAWAISDFIATKIDCMCLFATHFHELTALANTHRGVVNKHVAAHIEGSNMILLYQIKSGPCTQSFGIHVAKTAGFPPAVIRVAKKKAISLEHPSSKDMEERSHGKRMRRSLEAFAAMDIPQTGRSLLQNIFELSTETLLQV